MVALPSRWLTGDGPGRGAAPAAGGASSTSSRVGICPSQPAGMTAARYRCYRALAPRRSPRWTARVSEWGYAVGTPAVTGSSTPASGPLPTVWSARFASGSARARSKKSGRRTDAMARCFSRGQEVFAATGQALLDVQLRAGGMGRDAQCLGQVYQPVGGREVGPGRDPTGSPGVRLEGSSHVSSHHGADLAYRERSWSVRSRSESGRGGGNRTHDLMLPKHVRYLCATPRRCSRWI